MFQWFKKSKYDIDLNLEMLTSAVYMLEAAITELREEVDYLVDNLDD